MIIVNIRVPAIEKVYNFSVNEKVRTEDLIEEIVEMVKQKEGVRFRGDLSSLVLYSVDSGTSFRRERCLSDYGIYSGDELMLV